MSWVTVIWSGVASACLTLAAMYLMVWYRRRTEWASLFFSMTAVATAAMGFCELLMMWAETPEQFATALRWLHLPVLVGLIALVGFVRSYLEAGRPWLAWTACGLRTLSLLANFLFGQNLNYREVVHLRHIPLLGESVAVGEGVSNPWMLLGQISLVLFIVFVADAAFTVWRRGDRRLAFTIGGGIMFFLVAGTVEAILLFWQVVNLPLTVSIFFMGMVLPMAYELSRGVLHAAQLVDDLRASEARYRGIFEGAAEGMFRASPDRKFMAANPAMAKMLGYDSAEDIIRSIDDLERQVWLYPNDYFCYVRLLEEQGNICGYECQFKRRDGSKLWVSLSSRIVRGGDGRVTCFEGFAEDITEQKQSEMEIGRQRAQLTHISRVSTVGQLASSLAHELNQPLGAILRNAEAAELVLQDSSPDLKEVRAILADIRQDDHRAGEVIDRMRSLIRRREAERQRLDLNILAGEVIALVRQDAEMRRVHLTMERDPALPAVHGDHVQLQQVVVNLLLNAMDALNGNPPETRLVTVRTKSVGTMVELSVSDNGHGITSDRLPHVFDPFFTSKPNGLGLGLAISRTITEAHGGRLTAENNVVGGATFICALPAAERERAP